MQTTKRNYTRFARVSLVLSVALMVLATMAAPAFAEDELLIVDLILQAEMLEVVEPIGDGGAFEMVPVDPHVPAVIPDGGAFEMVPADQPAIPDGGDWEMNPGANPAIPDDGDIDVVPSDDPTDTPDPDVPDEPQNSDEPTETPDPDVPDEPQNSDEPTETPVPEPETPADDPTEPSLPFTGGNSTPFGIVGIAIALAGAGYLLRKRYVFARD